MQYHADRSIYMWSVGRYECAGVSHNTTNANWTRKMYNTLKYYVGPLCVQMSYTTLMNKNVTQYTNRTLKPLCIQVEQ